MHLSEKKKKNNELSICFKYLEKIKSKEQKEKITKRTDLVKYEIKNQQNKKLISLKH